MNIFYLAKFSIITSDSGTLITLYDWEELYQAKVFTPGYASQSFAWKCEHRKKFTRNELLIEDFHQLKISVKKILEKNP